MTSRRTLLVLTGAVVTSLASVALSLPASADDCPSLGQIVRDLDHRITVPDTAWFEDPAGGQDIVQVGRHVSAAGLAKVRQEVADEGGPIAVERIDGDFHPDSAGGDSLVSTDSSRECSIGFNVKLPGGRPGFLTAGHCGTRAWAATFGGPPIARTVSATYGRAPDYADYALDEYTSDTPQPSSVNLYNGSQQLITQAANARVGQRVSASGARSRLQTGTVTVVDVSILYPTGELVEHQSVTDMCLTYGDSGAPVFDGQTALGLVSGGSGGPGRCSTYFQPVMPALAGTGTTLG